MLTVLLMVALSEYGQGEDSKGDMIGTCRPEPRMK